MVSVVVPIYNEEELIVRFHEAVANAMQRVEDDWEVVYVNDGSKDSSLDLLKDCRRPTRTWSLLSSRAIGATWEPFPRACARRAAPR